MGKRKSLPLPAYPILDEAFYTIQETGGHLRRAESTIWSYISLGLLEAVQVGRRGTLVTGASINRCTKPQRPNVNIPELRKSREARRV